MIIQRLLKEDWISGAIAVFIYNKSESYSCQIETKYLRAEVKEVYFIYYESGHESHIFQQLYSLNLNTRTLLIYVCSKNTGFVKKISCEFLRNINNVFVIENSKWVLPIKGRYLELEWDEVKEKEYNIDIDIPVVLCYTSNLKEMVSCLCELRSLFMINGYNTYLLGNSFEGVLNGIDNYQNHKCLRSIINKLSTKHLIDLVILGNNTELNSSCLQEEISIADYIVIEKKCMMKISSFYDIDLEQMIELSDDYHKIYSEVVNKFK